MSSVRYRSPRRVQGCRICGNRQLIPVVDLGAQALTGRFRASFADPPPSWPITLVKCDDSFGAEVCGASQLLHEYDQSAFFGDFYGYRSSVTETMRTHLQSKADDLAKRVSLSDGDSVLDIGCNDGTLIFCFQKYTQSLWGVDPSAGQFAAEYEGRARLTVDFFPSRKFKENIPEGQKFKIVTSIACFYDLDDPIGFASAVADYLDTEGIWEIELAYMPRIMEKLGYDTVLHEHAVYYGLSQLEWIASRAGLKVVHAEENDINGASLRVHLALAESEIEEAPSVRKMRDFELSEGWGNRAAYDKFCLKIINQRDELRGFLEECATQKLRVFGYGASTKANVVLQYAEITACQVSYMLERYPPKYGLLTPGTNISIIPEEQGRKMRPDVLIVFIWQFRDEVVKRERQFLADGGVLLFISPEISIVTSEGSITARDFFNSRQKVR